MNTNFRPELLLRPLERLRSIVMTTSVCVCVSVFLSVCWRGSPEPHARSLPILCMLPYGRGLVRLRRRRDALCTFGFVDNIVFFTMGRIVV